MTTSPPRITSGAAHIQHEERSRTVAITVLLAALILAVPMSLAIGARTAPLPAVWDALQQSGGILSHPETANSDQLAVVQLRLPRTLLAIIVGAALGVAGSLVQGHTRNPLADPGILGISAGAAFAVVTGLSVFGIHGVMPSAILAFTGAIAATAVIFGLSVLGRGDINPLTLVLAGAALTAVINSMTSAFTLTDNADLDYMRFWTVGSVAGRNMDIFWTILPLIAVGLLAAFITGPQLNLLSLGEETASALGVNVRTARVVGMGLIALLAGAATAAAGPIGFIGLLIPHMARAITGPDYRWILPVSALGGSVLLLYADILGRVLARPAELQVGIILAFVGAPFFLFLIYRDRVVGL